MYRAPLRIIKAFNSRETKSNDDLSFKLATQYLKENRYDIFANASNQGRYDTSNSDEGESNSNFAFFPNPQSEHLCCLEGKKISVDQTEEYDKNQTVPTEVNIGLVGVGPANLYAFHNLIFAIAEGKSAFGIFPNKISIHLFDKAEKCFQGIWNKKNSDYGACNSPMEPFSSVYLMDKSRYSELSEKYHKDAKHLNYETNKPSKPGDIMTRLLRSDIGDSFEAAGMQAAKIAEEMGCKVFIHKNTEVVSYRECESEDGIQLKVRKNKIAKNDHYLDTVFHNVSLGIGHFDHIVKVCDQKDPKEYSAEESLNRFNVFDNEQEYDEDLSIRKANAYGLILHPVCSEIERAGISVEGSAIKKVELRIKVFGESLGGHDFFKNWCGALWTKTGAAEDPFEKGVSDTIEFPKDIIPPAVFLCSKFVSPMPMRGGVDWVHDYRPEHGNAEAIEALKFSNGGSYHASLARELFHIEQESILGQFLTSEEYFSHIKRFGLDTEHANFMKYAEWGLNQVKQKDQNRLPINLLRVVAFSFLGGVDWKGITEEKEYKFHLNLHQYIDSYRGPKREADQFFKELIQYISNAQPSAWSMMKSLADQYILKYVEDDFTEWFPIPSEKWARFDKGVMMKNSDGNPIWDEVSPRWEKTDSNGNQIDTAHTISSNLGLGKDFQKHPSPLIKKLRSNGIMTPDDRDESQVKVDKGHKLITEDGSTYPYIVITGSTIAWSSFSGSFNVDTLANLYAPPPSGGGGKVMSIFNIIMRMQAPSALYNYHNNTYSYPVSTKADNDKFKEIYENDVLPKIAMHRCLRDNHKNYYENSDINMNEIEGYKESLDQLLDSYPFKGWDGDTNKLISAPFDISPVCLQLKPEVRSSKIT